jgi:beta-N-acetylhexosaminidase
MHRLLGFSVIGQPKGAHSRRRRGRASRWAAATVLLAAGCSTQLHAAARPPPARTVLAKLSPAQLAGQRVVYSYTGVKPPARLLSLISRGEAAGVIFFTDNVGGPGQLAAAVRELDQAAAGNQDPVRLPLLLMTDQEGGLVRRLPGPPELSARQIGDSADPASTATQAGGGAAMTLRSNDLNVNLAPVLDVYRQPGNFISHLGRSFSSNPAAVATLGTDYAAAEQRGGVAATAKHFPGLGAAALSQNTDQQPVTLPLPASAIRNVDELPYRSAIAAHVKLIMLSWAVYPALDPVYPAGMSATIAVGELRHRLGFTGVTVTDALEAGALRRFGPIANRATLAARAGMDLLLCSQRNVSEGERALNALESGYLHGTLSRAAFMAADDRIMALRASLRSRPGTPG